MELTLLKNIDMRIGLSDRRRLPCIKIANVVFGRDPSVFESVRKAIEFKRMRIMHSSSDFILMELSNRYLALTSEHFRLLLLEVGDWKKHYLPVDIKGKTVLDVGAGCGETALFYFMNGARKVIAVERDPVKGQMSEVEPSLQSVGHGDRGWFV